MKKWIKKTAPYRLYQRLRWSIRAHFLPHGEVAIQMKNGEFRMDTRSWQIAPLITQYGKTVLVYEEKESKTFEELIQNGDTVLDIGAQAGYYTLLALHAGAGRVYAFEIGQRYVKEVKRQLEKSGLRDRAEVVRVALGKKDGEKVMFRNYFEKTRADGITLDTFCKERKVVPNVIKIDVQGNELIVLEGMKETLQIHRPKVMVMMYDELLKVENRTKEEGIALLEEAGYIVRLFTEDHAFLALPKEQASLESL